MESEVEVVQDGAASAPVVSFEKVRAWLKANPLLVTAEQFREAAIALVAVRDEKRRIEAKHADVVREANAAHKAATAARTAELGPLEEIDDALKGHLAAYLKTWLIEARDSTSLIERAAMLGDVEGFGYQTRVRVVVENATALVRAVARGKVPEEAVTVNTKWLQEQANQLRTALRMPGVRVEEYLIPTVGKGGPL